MMDAHSLFLIVLCWLTANHCALCQDDTSKKTNMKVMSNSTESTNYDLNKLFDEFLKAYKKDYGIGSKEYLKRKLIFKESAARVMALNKLKDHYKDSALYGITQFADMTPDEFYNKILKTRSILNRNHKHGKTISVKQQSPYKNIKAMHDVPQKVNWRERKVITPVKSQDKCGACWAFSTVETIESMSALKTGKLVSLSVQQMIDCAHGQNQGCDGGDTCSALEWMVQNNVHIQTESDYPYQDGVGICKTPNATSGVQVKNYTCINFTDKEEEMIRSLAFHGPLVAAVDATGWQDYLGGIIQYHCETNRNHAVQIVGYDLTGDVPYYIVRNTWGTSFGINGYLHIAIGKNLCAIAEEVSEVAVV